MSISKEDYLKELQTLEKTKTLSSSFLKYMHYYYMQSNQEKYDSRNQITDFNTFADYFAKWCNMPVTMGDTPQEMLLNQQPVDIAKAIQKTKNYFNNLYSIVTVNNT